MSELEAVVGHLFIVGGRAIRTASPGAVAMAAPRRAARGRDDDTLFALISLSPEQHQPASFYEGLVAALSDAYFSTAGSVTSALREAVTQVNSTLLAVNHEQEAPIRVGLACAVLREREVYTAIAGSARGFVIRPDIVDRLPTDDDVQEGLLPFGEEPDPDIRLFRHEVRAGDFLILADGALNRLTNTTLRHAAETGDVDSTLNNLATVAGEFATADVIKFVEATSNEGDDPRPAPPPTPEPPREDRRSMAEMGGSALLGLAKATEGARKAVETVLPEGEDNPLAERFHVSTLGQIALAVAIAVITALSTSFVYRLRGQTSQYAQFVLEARDEIETARSERGSQAEARPHWENALFLLDQADAIRPPSPEILELRMEALTALDNYDYVTRVSPIRLRQYPSGTVLKGPVIQGVDLYVIDETQDILYRETLDESGTTLINNTSQIITRQGELINDQVVSGLVDLVWMADGGVARRNVLAVLSRNGLLITYSPSFDADAAPLPGFEAWQDPRAIAMYERDLYILDAGANEIWRYEASTDSYSNAPQRYFTDSIPDLSDAIDLEIDTNGNFYVLHADGRISKYFLGREEPFEYSGLPQPIVRATALHINLGLTERAFFIADPGGGRLYMTGPTGSFLRNYKDDQNTTFEALTGVFFTERPSYVYVTAGGQLYFFSRPQQ